MYRIGQGIDFHRFAPDRPLVLGGIIIPYPLGLLGHSDADVLIHSMMDAMLGALALGDIGRHFPDTDPAYHNISSLKLLEHVTRLITTRGYRPVNLDSTLLAEKPKLMDHIPKMQLKLSETLNLEPERISIKATTTETMGSIGRREGIASMSVVLLERIN
ncbi:MAG: 2-C-methyl-D-erythritol 2,4-cyclodiphosphate synthase [Candidatus Delongbacteria bacterium]|nr:2-C-methyl-D-erythritol 2,4-cyclodiphosphate synthase [Candidatus Delongbacteria bacterium]